MIVSKMGNNLGIKCTPTLTKDSTTYRCFRKLKSRKISRLRNENALNMFDEHFFTHEKLIRKIKKILKQNIKIKVLFLSIVV